jgi:hypothetical protein
MTAKTLRKVVAVDDLHHRIFLIRGHRVILGDDIAALYGIQGFVLNQAMKRNRERFPNDFAFQLTDSEVKILTSQIGVG